MALPLLRSMLLPVALVAVASSAQGQDPPLRFKVTYRCADTTTVIVDRCETGPRGEFCFFNRFRGGLDLGVAYTRRPNLAMQLRTCHVVDAVSPAASSAPRGPASGAPASAAASTGSTARVESVVVAPWEAGVALRFAISPVGQHVAAIVLRGSRTVVTLDGADGPRFDEVLSEQGQGLHFSPDGTRLAYVGRQGQEYVYMVDNKEMLRLPLARYPQLSLASSTNHVSAPRVSANSRHVYFALYSQDPNGAGGWTVMVDGQRGPRSIGAVVPVFSRGDHYAYVTDSRAGTNTFTLIVDGQAAGYTGVDPEFNADGSHLFTRSLVPGQAAVDLDGRRLVRAPSVQLFFPPSGPNFLGVVTSTTAPFGAFLIDATGRKVAYSDCPGSPGIDEVHFNANGQHYAARCRTAGGVFLLADGKRTQEYQNIAAVDFAPDGRVVYQASSGGRSFVVVGDQESAGYPLLLLTRATMNPSAPDADRVAAIRGGSIGYIALSSTSQDATVVVNGKGIVRRQARDLVFSPDGSRFAFAWDRGLAGGAINVDGIDDPSGRTEPFFLITSDGYGAPQSRVLFSPDGKHVVRFGRQTTETAGVFVDGGFTATGAGNVVGADLHPGRPSPVLGGTRARRGANGAVSRRARRGAARPQHRDGDAELDGGRRRRRPDCRAGRWRRTEASARDSERRHERRFARWCTRGGPVAARSRRASPGCGRRRTSSGRPRRSSAPS